MYSDKYNRKSSRWDDVRSYYQPSHRNDRKYSSASANFDDRETEKREMKEAITAIVQNSGILGLKKEKIEGDEEQQPSSSIDESKDQTRPSSSSSSVAIIENDPNRSQSPRFQQLEADKANYLLPTFDHLSNFSPSIQCRKFFEDIQPLDRILARIVRIGGVAVIHVELVCTLTRFRRNLLAFMKGKLQAVAFDRTRRFYQVNDYISTTVMAVSPNTAELELQLDEDEAIYTQQGIPAYSRDFAPVDFDESSHISHLRDNPNLGLQLGVQINSRHSGLLKLAGKHLHLAPTAEKMRKEQTAKLAMTHVVRGAELTRQNKCFEAIQCFNKALAVDAECADAFVGRGAACAGMRNFEAALQDFDKAIQLQPNHRNGNKYRLEVLMAFGRDLEKSGNLEEARAKFDRILELNPGNPKALEAIQRISKAEKDKRAKKEEENLLELSEEEEEEEEKERRNGRNGYGRKRNDTMTEEEAKRNREKLNEMEEFIRKLKSTKK